MPSLRTSLLAALLLVASTTSPALARPEACAGLWTARNEIYKAQGYCFRTQRAIAAFGNAGCQYDDIVRQERALRCPR